MTSKEQTANELKRLDRKICCINTNINNLLSEDIIAALNGANNPSAGNVNIKYMAGTYLSVQEI